MIYCVAPSRPPWQQLSWARTPDSVAGNLRRLPRKLSELCKSFSLSANLFRAPAPHRNMIKKREDIENKKGLSECIAPHSKLIPAASLRQPKGKYARKQQKQKWPYNGPHEMCYQMQKWFLRFQWQRDSTFPPLERRGDFPQLPRRVLGWTAEGTKFTVANFYGVLLGRVATRWQTPKTHSKLTNDRLTWATSCIDTNNI